MKKYSLFLLLAMFLIQCQNNAPTEKAEDAMNSAAPQPLTEAEQQLAKEQATLAKVITPKMNDIAGKWQETDDYKSMIEIQGTQFIEYYERAEKGNASFAF